LVAGFIRIEEVQGGHPHRVHVVLDCVSPRGARSGSEDVLFQRGAKKSSEPLAVLASLRSVIDERENILPKSKSTKEEKMNNRLKQQRTSLQNCAKSISILAALAVAMAIASPAQVFTVMKHFSGPNGGGPAAPPVEGLDLNLYGITNYGSGYNFGTVFQLTPGGYLSVLYSFCDLCPTGYGFVTGQGLVLGTDGKLHGTTFAGGNTWQTGTVFTITTKGYLTTLYSFCPGGGSCPDGANPEAGLVQGNDGNYYGTTLFGGSAANNEGTFFRVTPKGTLTTLYNFCAGSSSCPDGGNPYGPIVQGTDGNFYGTTQSGGVHGKGGTVFRISPTGTLTTLYSFCASTFSGSCLDGDTPQGGVVEGADGNFYGTTTLGGSPTNCTSGCGTVFKLTPQGTLTTLFSPTFPSDQGQLPNGLIQATDGNFYGTTVLGGYDNQGIIFQITPAGTFTMLHSFAAGEGTQPQGGLMQKTDGNFYGTAYFGGNGNYGTVFRLSMGFGPFVKILPGAAKVGTLVKIYGKNLKGSTAVTFNGIPSTFVEAYAPTLVYATVPPGATTGPVQVTTLSSGILTSNVAFQVLP
jgi:uncharacterized repeat protein (TIGR03803 family)